jgi:hypothetical protein
MARVAPIANLGAWPFDQTDSYEVETNPQRGVCLRVYSTIFTAVVVVVPPACFTP